MCPRTSPPMAAPPSPAIAQWPAWEATRTPAPASAPTSVTNSQPDRPRVTVIVVVVVEEAPTDGAGVPFSLGASGF